MSQRQEMNAWRERSDYTKYRQNRDKVLFILETKQKEETSSGWWGWKTPCAGCGMLLHQASSSSLPISSPVPIVITHIPSTGSPLRSMTLQAFGMLWAAGAQTRNQLTQEERQHRAVDALRAAGWNPSLGHRIVRALLQHTAPLPARIRMALKSLFPEL